MFRLTSAVVIAACCAVAACEDSPTSTEPSEVTFTAQLSPANEVPPVTNADASGSGSVTVLLKVTRDSAGTITAATADFNVSLTGFVPGTTLTAAHIHAGAAGTNGDVVVDTGVTTGQVVLTNGSGSFTRNGISVTAQTAQNLITSPANFYFNVHTVLTPSGAVRGQLARQ